MTRRLVARVVLAILLLGLGCALLLLRTGVASDPSVIDRAGERSTRDDNDLADLTEAGSRVSGAALATTDAAAEPALDAARAQLAYVVLADARTGERLFGSLTLHGIDGDMTAFVTPMQGVALSLDSTEVIDARAAGYLSKSFTANQLVEDDGVVRLRLDATNTLRVRVVDSQLRPVSDRIVHWVRRAARGYRFDDEDPPRITSITSGDGVATLATSQAMLAIVAPDASAFAYAVTVAPGDVEMTLSLPDESSPVEFVRSGTDDPIELRVACVHGSPVLVSRLASARSGIRVPQVDSMVRVNSWASEAIFEGSSCGMWRRRMAYQAELRPGEFQAGSKLSYSTGASIQLRGVDRNGRATTDLSYCVVEEAGTVELPAASLHRAPRVAGRAYLPDFAARKLRDDPSVRVYVAADGHRLTPLDPARIEGTPAAPFIRVELRGSETETLEFVSTSGAPVLDEFRARDVRTGVVLGASDPDNALSSLRFTGATGAVAIDRTVRQPGFFSGTYEEVAELNEAELAARSHHRIEVDVSGGAIVVSDVSDPTRPVFALHESGRLHSPRFDSGNGSFHFEGLRRGDYVVGPREVVESCAAAMGWNRRIPGVVTLGADSLEIPWDASWFLERPVDVTLAISGAPPARVVAVPYYWPITDEIAPTSLHARTLAPNDPVVRFDAGQAAPHGIAFFVAYSAAVRTPLLLADCGPIDHEFAVQPVRYEVTPNPEPEPGARAVRARLEYEVRSSANAVDAHARRVRAENREIEIDARSGEPSTVLVVPARFRSLMISGKGGRRRVTLESNGTTELHAIDLSSYLR